eukprot:CAMPEP_0203866862 /NCGR_PEP_ID=MMETSP0359-20131031/16194_1 /ASSEMBLY_ACC=CAM_ASM_000338 /TAXON_ID=268821 /ORGANISM="Scrippsiella Hangoei, Strain SHTV-5" /LENGTH=233 /DNA_ID=CAMNT_0050785025 /DNA_START=101 /DNA_END=799 /DNA_ORIENTATION=+
MAPLVVGVAGPSGSGKSTLAKALAEELGGLYLPEDPAHFVLPHVPYASRDERYEAPSNVDWPAARRAVLEAVAGASEEQGCQVVVVEHYLLLAEEGSLHDLIDRCVFLDPSYSVGEDEMAMQMCMERRAARSQRSDDENAHLRRYFKEGQLGVRWSEAPRTRWASRRCGSALSGLARRGSEEGRGGFAPRTPWRAACCLWTDSVDRHFLEQRTSCIRRPCERPLGGERAHIER